MIKIHESNGMLKDTNFKSNKISIKKIDVEGVHYNIRQCLKIYPINLG